MTISALYSFGVEWFRSRGKAASMAQVIALRSLAMGISIMTSLLTAAVLGPSGRGEQAALVLAPTFLGGIASLGLHGSLIYNLKADPAHAGELLGTVLILTFFTGVAATVAGWIVLPYWLSQYNADTIAVGRILLLVAPLIVVSWSLAGAAESQGWFGLVNQTIYMQGAATLAMLAILAVIHRLTPTTSAVAYLLPMIPAFIFVWVKISRRLRPIFRIRREYSWRVIHYSMRLCGNDLLGTLAVYVNQLVIVAYMAPSMVGLYTVALGTARLLSVVETGVCSVLFPSIAARRTAQIVDSVGLTFRVTTLLMIVLASFLMIAGPPVLRFAYGERFVDAIAPFRVLLLAMVVENGAQIFYQIYHGGDRPGVVTIFEVFAVSITVVAMLLLMPIVGIVGAALAMLIASTFRLTISVSCLKPIFRIAPPRLVPNWSDVTMIWGAISRPVRPSDGPGLEPVP